MDPTVWWHCTCHMELTDYNFNTVCQYATFQQMFCKIELERICVEYHWVFIRHYSWSQLAKIIFTCDKETWKSLIFYSRNTNVCCDFVNIHIHNSILTTNWCNSCKYFQWYIAISVKMHIPKMQTMPDQYEHPVSYAGFNIFNILLFVKNVDGKYHKKYAR